MKQSIATKIFGLALSLLALTIAIAVYLSFEAERTLRAVNRLVEADLPLSEAAQRIAEAGLRRRLAFERWFGALNADSPNTAVVTEASQSFEHFTSRIVEDIAAAQRLVAAYPLADNPRPEVAELGLLLKRLEKAYASRGHRQRELLAIQATGDHRRANELLNLLTDQLNELREIRNELQGRAAALAALAAEEVRGRHRTVRWLTILVTGSGVLFGLAFAALVTHRLTKPVRRLVSGLDAVHRGDLEVQVPVQSRDEVGALTDAFNFFIREMRSKEQIKQTFGKYIDPRVVEHVLAQPDAGGTRGDRRVMSVVFADLVGFTALSERLTPSLVVTVLNRHFGLQAKAVQSHHGVVDKFIGDAVMAYFGPPFVDESEHPALACRACLAQLAALRELRTAIPEITGLRKEAPQVDLRIGIATGDVVVGNLGSENAMSYTVIGDTVNLASRIESANRLYGTCILLTEETARRVAGQFELREIDAIAVKGKTEPVIIYELLAEAGALQPARAELRSAYAEGLKAYRSRDWQAAETSFRRALAIEPADGPARTMLSRLPALGALPEEAPWDGIFAPTEK
jgi:adenylate cyclase